MNRILKTFLIIFLLFVLFSNNIFAYTTSLPSYEPYEASEFRPWMHKLRRAEVITLGATALTFPVVGLIAKYDDNTTDGFWKKFAWSAGAGVLIAVADFVIGEVQEKNEKKLKEKKTYRELSPLSPEALKLEEMKKNSEKGL